MVCTPNILLRAMMKGKKAMILISGTDWSYWVPAKMKRMKPANINIIRDTRRLRTPIMVVDFFIK